VQIATFAGPVGRLSIVDFKSGCQSIGEDRRLVHLYEETEVALIAGEDIRGYHLG
jgi:hypothetical protein